MMNMNPMNLMQMMGGISNPKQMVMNLIKQNPQMQQIMPMIQGKNPQQIEQMARNMCKERGIDAEQFANQIKQQFAQMQQHSK